MGTGEGRTGGQVRGTGVEDRGTGEEDKGAGGGGQWDG